MSFNESINRVRRAERALDVSTRKVGDHWQQLRQTWRAAWTPSRIVIAGITSGFVVGFGELPRATGSGVINLVTAISSLFAVDQAGAVAEVAGDAADQAQQAVEVATTDAAPAPAATAMTDEDETIRTHDALRRSGAW